MRLKTRACNSDRGFTLIEVAISIVFLGVALLGLAQLFAITLQQGALARNSTAAVEVGRGRLEELKAHYNAELESGTSSTDLTPGLHGPQSVEVSSDGSQVRTFLLFWDVQLQGAADKMVTVTVIPQPQNLLTSKTVTLTARFTP